MVIANLFARLGFDVDTSKVEGFQKNLKAVKFGLLGAATAATGFVYVIKKITDESFNTAMALKQFEAETNTSMETLQKWQSVAERTNNSAQAVSESIRAISLNQQKIKLGQGNISGYQLLGIDPDQDPFDILEELRTKTKDLSQESKRNVLGMMGVSSELIQVLDLTNEQFSIMANQAFVIPTSAINTLDKARSSMVEVGQGIKWLKAMISTELAPEIIKINKRIIEWIKANKGPLVKSIKTIFMWITKFTGSIINAISMINLIIEKTIGWKNALAVLTGFLIGLGSLLLASPLGIFIAGLVLLVAVLDDLYVYSQGKGKSLFGNLMKQFPEMEKQLKTIIELFKNINKFADIFSGEKRMKTVGEFKQIQEEQKKRRSEVSATENFKQVIRDFKGLFGGGNKNTTNNYNINQDIRTTANAEETANIVDEKLQKVVNAASAQRVRNE